MAESVKDLAQIRLDNALALFDDFVRATVRDPEATGLRGLDGLFAEKLRIQPSYWSQIKARTRQIGERLARQFELHCGKPQAWLDEPHASPIRAGAGAPPVDDDERFVVDLVLSYYRRDPAAARAKLLALLGEALQPPARSGSAVGRASATPRDDVLWSNVRAKVSPLRRKR